MKTFKIFFILLVVLSFCNRSKTNQSGLMDSSLNSDSTLFKSLVTQYTESIDRADTILGARLWSNIDKISFIHPRGHEHGWSGIKNIYNMFRDNFSERKLSFYNLRESGYSDFAWLEFYWVFDAVTKSDGSKIQTKGRETQIWRKLDNEWRLIHVHYSGMPVLGERQGF